MPGSAANARAERATSWTRTWALAIAVVVGALALTWPAAARACKPVMPTRLQIARPAFAAAGLRLLDEDAVLHCEAPARHSLDARCTWTARYRVGVEPGAPPRATGIVAITREDSGGQATLQAEGDGIASRAPTDAEVRAWMTRTAKPAGLLGSGPPEPDGPEASIDLASGPLQILAFDVAVPPSGALVLTVHAETNVRLGGPDCVLPGVEARHLLVHDVFLYGEVEIAGTDEGRPERARLSADLPPTWRIVERGDGRSKRRDATLALSDTASVHVQISRSEHVRRGGPFFAAGGNLGDGGRLRLRAGYEHAAPRYLIHALAVETDTHNAVVIPSTEVATGVPLMVPYTPSLAIGVGVPIQVYPQAHVGFRVQATVSWFVVSFVANLDVYPIPGGRLLRGGLMGQVSF